MADHHNPTQPNAAPSNAIPTSSTQGAAFVPTTDKFTTRCLNFFNMATKRMSPEGQRQYWADTDRRYEEVDCKRCEDQKEFLMKYSPTITFLSRHINQLGGEITKDNIYCRRCDKDQAGGFDPVYGIKICANQMRNQGHLEDTIAHEMVHAYDCLRFKSNWKNDLRHAACTEVRLQTS